MPCVGNGEEETPLHPLAQPLIHEFGDVFPSDMPPRLPPFEGLNIIETTIIGDPP